MRKSLLVVLIIVGAAFSIVRHLIPEPQPTKSIAVLPFVDLGSVDDQGYFADGLREEITNRIARSGRGLTVTTSDSRFQTNATPLSEIARTLRVDAVLQGSIRRTGNRVHATFSLFDTSKRSVTWTRNYDLQSDSQFALENQLAESVVPSVTGYVVQ
jgi:adenylate cyclase